MTDTVGAGDKTSPKGPLLVAVLLGVLGVTLFTRFADRVGAPWTGIPAVLGLLLTIVGWSYAVALVIAPAPRSITLRHLAAGSVAALLAWELAGGARRMGLTDTMDAFRVFWAPISEELCKMLLLAAVWTASDERRSRTELVTAAVAVGAGFALRENYLYFFPAIGPERLYLEWVLLRAVPPVLAHCSFAMIQGGVLAHLAVHARATGEPLRRFSWPGFVLAALAHVTFNGVALLITKVGGAWVIELTMLWSLAALVVALLLRARVRSLAQGDEPAALSMVPSRDHHPRMALGVFAVTLVCCVALFTKTSALGGPRYVAMVLTPAVLAWAFVHFGARALGVERAFTAVLVGLAVRPLVRCGELIVGSIGATLHRGPPPVWLKVLFLWLSNMQWAGVTVLLTYAIARKRGPHGAVVFASGVAAGIAGSYVVSTLASISSANPGRDMLLGFALYIPRTLGLAAVAGLLTHGRDAKRRVLVVTMIAGALATLCDVGVGFLHGATLRAVVSSVFGLGLFVAIVAVERARGLRAGITA